MLIFKKAKVYNTRASQKFCNILLTGDTMSELQMLLPSLWRNTLNCKIPSLPDTLQVLTWLCLIKVLATQVKFFEPSDYCTIINCAFTFCTINIFGCFCDIVAQFKLVKHKFLNLITLHIYLCSFQITHGWSNTRYVSTPTTTTLTTTAGTFHSLNCFGHIICIPQTSMYQNIAKLLTHPSNS